MHVWNYLCVCLTSKFIGVHILSRVQAHVKSIIPKPHVRRACLTSKFVDAHILSCVITSTRATRELLKEHY